MPDSPGLFTFTAVAPPGIGTQTVTDDFNRANEAPMAGNWAQSTAARFNLTSSQVVLSATPDDNDAIWTPWASGDAHYSQAKITSGQTGAGTGAGVWVRHSPTASTNTGYRIVVDASGNYELLKMPAATSLRTGTVSYVAGLKLGLSATGGATTTLKIWYNGVQIGANVTDASSPVTTGVPGIGYSSINTGCVIDDWSAGTVP